MVLWRLHLFLWLFQIIPVIFNYSCDVRIRAGDRQAQQSPLRRRCCGPSPLLRRPGVGNRKCCYGATAASQQLLSLSGVGNHQYLRCYCTAAASLIHPAATVTALQSQLCRIRSAWKWLACGPRFCIRTKILNGSLFPVWNTKETVSVFDRLWLSNFFLFKRKNLNRILATTA